VILLDEEKGEFYFKAAALDDQATENRMKEVRWPATRGVAARVVRTGQPAIVPDTGADPDFYSVVDIRSGVRTRSMLDVPLKIQERTIGVLCAMNKKSGVFEQGDAELLNAIAGSIALSVENARYAEELRAAYDEVASLNRAKDKVINHLSHELKTPLAVLRASLNILRRQLSTLSDEGWHATLERAERNLNRILELQYEVEDIMRDSHYTAYHSLSWLIQSCADELASLLAEEVGEGEVVNRIRRRVDEIFGPVESVPEKVLLHEFVPRVIQEIRRKFSHREVEVVTRYEPVPPVWIPSDVLHKVVVGLVRNAVENTPDEGKVDIRVHPRGKGAELVVRDYGVGITPDHQRRIFEGFFTTQDTMDYSSRRPYDFNAGGKGADLLRMKIFSERYGFQIHMSSQRCRNLPTQRDICPGRISRCDLCRERGDCHQAAGTTFTVFFPAAEEHDGIQPNTS
jgi:signal transduction histidine kinase